MKDPYSFEILNQSFREDFSKKNVVLTFTEYLELIAQNPKRYLRNSAEYIIDTFDYFSTTVDSSSPINNIKNFKLFDIGIPRTGPIIGGGASQTKIYNLLQSFKHLGFNSHLALLYGPNGSAKSSTIETIAHGMEIYSQTDEGAAYRFNWIFPKDEEIYPPEKTGHQKIGFQDLSNEGSQSDASFAKLQDQNISSKISSEFKENPVFLLPVRVREKILKSYLAKDRETSPEQVKLAQHLKANGLSRKNQDIFEHLLNAYKGDLNLVFRHVQVERFFFSRKYRAGISTVEPQMSIDARDKQVTLDANYANLPTILQTIDFHQSSGPLVEANRGMLEFSDLLKRPLDSFKYLLGTIEKGTVNLESGTASLDLVFVGSTNDKHLDAFKMTPEFSSFKGRFELITVPYLLLPKLEEKIYIEDINSLNSFKKIAPHTVELLCFWGVLTRLNKPDPENYHRTSRSLITRLDPESKLRLYENKSLLSTFLREEESHLKKLRKKIFAESQGMLVYEGRFGASPRELRSIIHKSSQNKEFNNINPMCIFSEIATLIKDKSVYDFLQLKPQDKYHDVEFFLELIKSKFAKIFEEEILNSMNFAKESEYGALFSRYLEQVIASINNEKIWDQTSQSYTPPSQQILENVENILILNEGIDLHRNTLITRVAAWKIDHPQDHINVETLFPEHLAAIKKHFYSEKQTIIENNMKNMIHLSKENNLKEKQKKEAELIYKNLEKDFGYSQEMARDCLIWLLKYRKKYASKESDFQKNF